jgi:hypothetical protein
MDLKALIAIVHWEIYVGFWTSASFPVVTRFFWPWNQSWWGWNTVLLELSIAGTLFPDWLYLQFGINSSALPWAQAAFLGLVIANVLWRTVMIWRTQRDGAEAERSQSS